MINLDECLSEFNIEIKKVIYKKNYIIIESTDSKYLLKIRDSNKKKLFQYLESIGFKYYLPLINDYDDYFELYNYYDDKVDDNTKGKEMIFALCSLHLKSVISSTYSRDDIKRIYEEKVLEIDNMMRYYLDLQDYIDTMSFPTASYYLLIKNISKIYELLRRGRIYLDNWYNIDDTNYNEVLLLNNLSLDDFRVGDVSYFLNIKDFDWSLAVYDLEKFYKSNFNVLDIKGLIKLYDSNCRMDNKNILLFNSLICIPWKINFSNNIYLDTIEVRKLIDYVTITLDYLEENKEDEKANKDEFKE
jgi:hypothetical protein